MFKCKEEENLMPQSIHEMNRPIEYWMCLLIHDSGSSLRLQVAVACISPKYIVSQLCMKEVGLADLLRKPIIPILYSKVPWPPPGGMALTFSQLVYININGKCMLNIPRCATFARCNIEKQ